MQNYAFANLFMCREYEHLREADVFVHLHPSTPPLNLDTAQKLLH